MYNIFNRLIRSPLFPISNHTKAQHAPTTSGTGGKMVSPKHLRRYDLFDFMGEKELEAVTAIAKEKEYQEGDVIVEFGRPADTFYFLAEGDVAYYYVVTTENDPYYKKEYFISNINAGEIFGISALIAPYRYTATLRVDKPSRVVEIVASELRALCDADPKLAYGLMQAVAKAAIERLEATRIQLIAARAV
jgi:CRP/FNR family cyclic AMP-dependent transcriptional regulator